MGIQMIGIDHEKATVQQREIFSFSTHAALEAMKYIKQQYEIEGCVLLSTCNRTELYISAEEENEILLEILCQLIGVDADQYQDCFMQRAEGDAIDHLFYLACGMKSKIFGEDQIITQVKHALALAREAETTDIVLEKLFQTAITAAKKVKTQVHLTAVQTSVVETMMECLNQQRPQWEQLSCLVIGNGEIGRNAAKKLLEAGADVTMTVRHYKTKQVDIPQGCQVIEYQNRYQDLSKYQVIVSGTTSPHHTLTYENANSSFQDGEHRILFDLAVPRDIESKLDTNQNIILYNIDTLNGENDCPIDQMAVDKAKEIIETYQEEFETWNLFRNYVPLIQAVGHWAGLSTYKRAEKKVKKVIEADQQQLIEKTVRSASEKVVTSMLYGLKENLPMEHWQACLSAIETIMLDQKE